MGFVFLVMIYAFFATTFAIVRVWDVLSTQRCRSVCPHAYEWHFFMRIFVNRDMWRTIWALNIFAIFLICVGPTLVYLAEGTPAIFAVFAVLGMIGTLIGAFVAANNDRIANDCLLGRHG